MSGIALKLFNFDNYLWKGKLPLARFHHVIAEVALDIVFLSLMQPDMLLRGVQALARTEAQLGMDSKRPQSGIDACAVVLNGEIKQSHGHCSLLHRIFP